MAAKQSIGKTTMIPKLNLSNSTSWQHHRSGWGYCMNVLSSLHSDYGILVLDYIEKIIKDSIVVTKPWIGFIHNVPCHPTIIDNIYGTQYNWDLKRIVESQTWLLNLKFCRGIFCLSSENLAFLRENLPSQIPVEMIYHTTEIPSLKFEFDKFMSNKYKKVVFVGHWMRNFQSIFDLQSIYPKFILRGSVGAFNYDKIPKFYDTNSSVSYIERLDNQQYDTLFSENLIFLNLYGSSANNTVIECIARNNPIIINRLPSLEDYLGVDYPLFYEDLSEASSLIQDTEKIYCAFDYIKERVNKIDPMYFLDSVVNSKIYNSIDLVCLP